MCAPCGFGSISPPASAQRPAPTLSAAPAATGRSRCGGPSSSHAGACNSSHVAGVTSSSHVPHAEKVAETSGPLRCPPPNVAPEDGRLKLYHPSNPETEAAVSLAHQPQGRTRQHCIPSSWGGTIHVIT